MKPRDYLKIGLVTTTLVFGANTAHAKGIEEVVNSTNQTQNDSQAKKNKLSTPQLIRAATLEDCFDFVEECKKNTPFKQQIEKHGYEKTSIQLAKIKSYSVNLAEKYAKSKKEISDKEYLTISKQIGQDQIDFRKGHTNPLDKKVISVRVKTLKIATEAHRKILSKVKGTQEVKDVEKQYFGLVRENFTEKEYTEYCEQMADSMDEYYDAIGKTLGWKIVFGKGDLDKMKKASRTHYFATRDKIYKKQGGKK